MTCDLSESHRNGDIAYLHLSVCTNLCARIALTKTGIIIIEHAYFTSLLFLSRI